MPDIHDVEVEGSAVCDGEQGLGEEDPHEPLPNKGAHTMGRI